MRVYSFNKIYKYGWVKYWQRMCILPNFSLTEFCAIWYILRNCHLVQYNIAMTGSGWTKRQALAM